MDMQYVLLAVLAGGLIALLYAFARARWINRQPSGDENLRRISGYIAQGAMTFLGREYRALVPFVIVAGGFLAALNWGRLSFQGLSFALGASCSALAGFVGMRVATAANVRTTEAARSGLPGALRVAFVGGSVMGMSVVGLGLVGVSAVILVTVSILGTGMPVLTGVVTPLLTGFALGGSSIALFMRVGGGIYTKAADIGADLVGKLEAGIPEDDPRNPATIADNVGDNVGRRGGHGGGPFRVLRGRARGQHDPWRCGIQLRPRAAQACRAAAHPLRAGHPRLHRRNVPGALPKRRVSAKGPQHWHVRRRAAYRGGRLPGHAAHGGKRQGGGGARGLCRSISRSSRGLPPELSLDFSPSTSRAPAAVR